MKSIKLPIKLIIIIMTVIGLAIAPACQASEPEVIEEPIAGEETIIEEEPETVEEPEATEGETEVSEEPEAVEEEATEEEPELLWSVEYEDQDFGLDSIAISPDGETLVVGSFLTTYTHLLYDGRIIDANTSYRHSVEDIDFSPDGSVMGVGLGVYGSVLIDTEDGSELFQLHGGFNNRIAFSPDGEHVATGNRDGIIWIWDTESGEQVAVLEEPDADFIMSIDYHPSGKLLAATDFDGIVYIWDIEEERIVHTIDLDSSGYNKPNPFRFSPDGEIMAAIIREDWDYKVRLWTVVGQEKIADLEFSKEVEDIAFSPDVSLLAVASLYLETTIWDVETGTLLYTLDQELDPSEITGGSHAVAFTSDGGHLAVVRDDGPLELWRLPGAEPLEEPEIDMKEPPPIPSDVLFDTDSAELKATADVVLEELAEDLFAALPEATITFIGHTDSRGASTYNLQLSIDRATAVRDWFESWAQENGVDGWELLVDGKGEAELKVSDVDAEGTFREEAGKLNRRVEIEIEIDN
jgi:WD40 repeat protein